MSSIHLQLHLQKAQLNTALPCPTSEAGWVWLISIVWMHHPESQVPAWDESEHGFAHDQAALSKYNPQSPAVTVSQIVFILLIYEFIFGT